MKEPENDQQKLFIDTYLDCRNVYEAARLAGYEDERHGYKVLRKYKDYVLDLMAHKLILAGPEAIHKLQDMLGDGATAPGANTRLEAAKQVLDRIGLVKKEKIEVEAAQGGIFIIPAKAAPSES